MIINPYLIVFFCVLLVFCCFLLPALLYMRQYAMRADVTRIEDKVSHIMREYATFCEKSSDVYKKVAVVEAELHAAKTRDESTQETIRNLGNKMNSRFRAERKNNQQPTEDREEDQNMPDFEHIERKFPGSVVQLSQQTNGYQSPDPYEREFGEMP